MGTKKAILIIIVTLTWLLLSAGASVAATLCVNPTGTGGCYSTINAAITAAATGDTVSVMPGTYVQNVTVNKSIVLYGQQGIPCATNILPDTGAGVTFAAGSSGATIEGFTVEASQADGIVSTANVTPIYIYNCVVQNCGWDGIEFWNGGLYVQNCVVQSNLQDGIYTQGGTHFVYNSIFVNNRRYGLENSGGAMYHEYNCLWGNTYAFPLLTGEISLDPKFVDLVGCDLHLQSFSPCIDKGRPGLANLDCDGTLNDMGVYGGPYAYCGPGPVVTQLQLIPATVVKGETFQIQAKGAAR